MPSFIIGPEQKGIFLYNLKIINMGKQVKGENSSVTANNMHKIKVLAGSSLGLVLIICMLSCFESPGTIENASLLMPLIWY